MENQLGKTKDVGFQFGIRKTFSVSSEKVWDFLFSENGLNIWLGKLKNELEIKKEYETENGITGLVRVFKSNSHIRLNWKPVHWENVSTVQIRVIGNQTKATIAIHQEKLLNTEQRNEMKAHWNEIMKKIGAKILI
ncbi:SRPBCC domain-containing protein [Arenibacter algicola]|uniref:SRPBCC domain-containing protein n=1 Tax=Arenibacter algicola TaxID=616991 RepID=UPI001C067048|nr:SRPBCC domain-containing protein [Arenibacter algicola]MBU2905859.1 SRPBCC domain-containing protein [Arenibacter algicola]